MKQLIRIQQPRNDVVQEGSRKQISAFPMWFLSVLADSGCQLVQVGCHGVVGRKLPYQLGLGRVGHQWCHDDSALNLRVRDPSVFSSWSLLVPDSFAARYELMLVLGLGGSRFVSL